MIRYNAFWRKFITRKLADLSRLLPIEELTELPVGAMGHILDNFNLTQPISLVPRKNSVIWKLKPEKKILYNYTQPIKDPIPVPISMKGITLPQAGLSREILKFKSENMQLVKTVLDPSQLPVRPNVQCLISYNSLFRMRIPGVLRIYRMMNFIFSNIIDQVCQFPDRVHFIHIPFSDVEEINSTTAVESLMNDIEYILNFLEEENNNYNVQNGIYGWEDEYYLFSHNKLEYSNEVYSRSDFLRSFKEHTKATIRYPQTPQYLFLMHLFGFVESNSKVSLFEYIPDDMLDKINFLLTTDKFALIYNLAELRRLNGDSNTILLRLIANVNDLIRSNYEDPKEYTNVSINDESSEEADDQLVTQSIKKTNKPIPDTPIELLSYEPVEDDVIGDDSLIRLNDIKVGTPNATNTPAINITPLEYEIIETYNLENTQSFVDKMASSIQSDTTLSNAQRTRAAKMAFAYKELTYDNVPVGELLDIPIDESLDDSKLDFFDNSTEVPDKSMLDSSISVFNSSYMKKTFNHDMVSTLVSFNEQGMFLTDIKTEDKSDELNRLIQYRVTYEDKKHKKHTIKFTIPKFDEDGTCYVNGTVKIIKPQRISNPITKIGPDTVRLNSNYNRYLIQRNTTVAHSIDQKITKLLRKHSDRVSITSKNNDYKELTVPYDYSAIGSKINTIVIDDGTYKFIFEYSNRFNDKFVDSIGLDYLKEIENNLNAVYIGYRSKTKIEYYFLKLDGSLVSIDKQEKNIAYTGTLLDKICEILGERPTPLTEYITFETTSKILPIIIPLAYRFGLSNILTYLNATYDIVDINERISTTPSDIVIKFKDKKLIFKRYPTLVSLIVAGLSEYDLRNINLEEMDSPDIYFSLIQSKGLSPHVIKSIDNYFDLFLDPMTKDVLLRMGEPTNTKDLLIRGVQLLVTTDHKAVASATNYRFRSYERIPAIIYNTLATNFANYRAKAAGTKDTFSISEFEVYQNILKDPLLETVDVINPINDIKYMCEYSHVGMSGRTQESFVVNDRRYEKDAIGTMSEAAVDNSKVGMNAQMPMNPSIINTRGMTAHVPSEDIEPSQLLSVTGLVMPGLTNDDVKRANFANIQASAVMPTKKSEVSRIRTGYEEIIAHRTHMPFAYVAKHDGVIVDIDTDLKMIKLQYKDNSTYSVHYGEEYTSNSGSGFYTTQKIVVNNWKVGDRFKKGDVICYNPEFFTPDPFSKQVAWNIGVLANVAFLECDGTLEDSSVVSKRLGDDLEIAPVHVRTITISKKSTIHKYIPVGVECSSLDNLIVFDESALEENLLNTEDDELANMLADLNHSTPKAKYDGVVVKIETFFRCDLNEMSPSLQKLVKVCNKDKNAKAEFASDSKNNYKYQKLNKITQSDRLGNIDLTDDVVVLKFYIQQHHGMHAGDKIVYDSSLKSVCARVLEEPILSEDKSVEVDALMSYRSINARLIMSPILVGAATRVIEKLESDILDIYFDDKSSNGSNEHLDHTLSLENSSSVNDIDIAQESLETKMLDQMSSVHVSTEGWFDPVKEDGMRWSEDQFDQIVDKKERETMKKFFRGFESLDVPEDCTVMTEALTAAQMKTWGDELYHGSPNDLTELKGYKRASQYTNSVFLSPLKGIASIFVIDKRDLYGEKNHGYRSIHWSYDVWKKDISKLNTIPNHIVVYHNAKSFNETRGKSTGYIYTVKLTDEIRSNLKTFGGGDTRRECRYVGDAPLRYTSKQKITVTWETKFDPNMVKQFGPAVESFSVSLERYDPPYNEEQMREHGYSEETIERLKNDPVHRWRMETGIELIHREPTRTELKRIWKNWQQMTPDQKRISDRKCKELFGCDNKTLYEYLIRQYKVESPAKGVVKYPPKSNESSSEAISANTKDEDRGPISESDKKKIGKYIYHGTHRDLNIKNLGIHVCKNRANTDIKAPVVYMNRSIGVASLHVVPFMIGHGSKLKNYEEHFVNLEEAIRSESPVQHVEIIHNDPNLEECSGEQTGYIYWVKAKEFLDDLYYATPDKPNDWNFVSYRQLPIAKKTKVKVTWHKRYDEKFAKKINNGYKVVE